MEQVASVALSHISLVFDPVALPEIKDYDVGIPS
jgi:hypothetical protein